MFTTEDIARFSAKCDAVLSKRSRPHDSNDNSTAPKGLSIIKKISKGKFPIYLASSKFDGQMYVMKVFPHVQEEFKEFYKNEIRFASLKHPNVINMIYHQNEKEAIQHGQLKKISYILMEYAPYGDFFDFIANQREHIDEKLARTYFHQLIDGLDHLHRCAVAHLDLKPENLLLGIDFTLKIADFDLSYVYGDTNILSRGTRNYRCPELFTDCSSRPKLEDPFAADIYSAGVILFILVTGIYPHSEERVVDGINFAELMYSDNQRFWRKHCEIQGRRKSHYSVEFKELFNNMVKANHRERPTIRQIKRSRWYNGPVYSPSELKEKMENLLGC